MKRLFVLLFSLALANVMHGQNLIQKQFSAYESLENYTNVTVTGKMFNLASYLETEEENPELEEFKEFVSTIQSFQMIVGREVANPNTEYQSALRKIPSSHEELMTVKDDDGNFSFFINESAGTVHELVMVGMGKQEFLVFSLTGEMELKKLAELAKFIQASEFRQMSKVTESGLAEVNIFPNPAPANGNLTVEVPEQLIGGQARVLNLKGQVVKTIPLNSISQKLSTSGLAAGIYIFALEKGPVSIKKRVAIQ